MIGEKVKSADNLLNSIEESRRKMNELAQGKSLTDPIVLEASQGLDVLLNEYYAGLRKAPVYPGRTKPLKRSKLTVQPA